MKETELLTSADREIQQRIQERHIHSRKKRRITEHDRKLQTLHFNLEKQFLSFRYWIRKIDWQIEYGLIYNRETRVKTCTKCGHDLTMQQSFQVHKARYCN